MSVYAVSFRLKDSGDAEASYAQRYKTLRASISALDVVRRHWHGTTSFHIIESYETAADLRSRLYNLSEIALDDEVLVINLSLKTYAASSGIRDATTLESLMDDR